MSRFDIASSFVGKIDSRIIQPVAGWQSRLLDFWLTDQQPLRQAQMVDDLKLDGIGLCSQPDTSVSVQMPAATYKPRLESVHEHGRAVQMPASPESFFSSLR